MKKGWKPPNRTVTELTIEALECAKFALINDIKFLEENNFSCVFAKSSLKKIKNVADYWYDRIERRRTANRKCKVLKRIKDSSKVTVLQHEHKKRSSAG